ncbi:MAG TPA: alpha-amylase family protein [Stellaceae bacterium]|nr:alpha-amylase family protein [Stellaceae bacterium]
MAGAARRAGRAAIAVLVATILGGGTVAADQLVMPKTAGRNTVLPVVYRFEPSASGRGRLDITWTDADGRVVEQHRIPLELKDAMQVTFALDLHRAVAMQNWITANLRLRSTAADGARADRHNELAGAFIATPPDTTWRDYQIVMWQPQTAAAYRTLKRLGITAGMVEAGHQADEPYDPAELAPLLGQDLRFYLENIATDFYSPYHRWSATHPVDWRFQAIAALHRRRPDDLAAFWREPSLSDPDWLLRVRTRLIRAVTALRGYRPLYYDLGDETGIGDLGRPWDFDFSPLSLAAMRVWLRRRYGSLAALNREWDTHFPAWDRVVPITTRQALRRSDQDFAAWADFKDWMDVAFAAALASGTAAVHAADPGARSAIEGVQIPGWGGYDYPRLARAVDVMEPYDFGCDIEMLRSLNPQLVLLTTIAASGAQAAYLTWRELLRGTRGVILWDPNHEFVGTDGRLHPRGEEAAATFAALRDGLGMLLINLRRHTDGVAVLYSQPSLRMAWLLDRRAHRPAAQTADDPSLGSYPRTAACGFTRTAERLGIEPEFIAAAQLARGALQQGRYRVLMLPDAIALSPAAARAISAFVARGGIAIAAGEPGQFDAHGRKLPRPLLADVFPGGTAAARRQAAFRGGRAFYLPFAGGAAATELRTTARIFAAGGVTPPIAISGSGGTRPGDLDSYLFDDGPVTVLALQREALGPLGDRPAPSGAGSHEAVVVSLPQPLDVYELRTGRALGRTAQIALSLGPGEPVLLALSSQPLPGPTLAGPRQARLGSNVAFTVRSGRAPAIDVVHFEAIDPAGLPVAHYSQNLLLSGGSATVNLPLAVNDPPGTWQIRVRDALDGGVATMHLAVGE